MISKFKKLRENSKAVRILIISLFLIFLLTAVLYLFKQNASKPEVEQVINNAQKAFIAGDFPGAAKEFQTALKLDSKNPTVFAGLITSIVSEGNQRGQENETYKQAEPYIKKALAVAGKNKDVLVAVGYANETRGDYNSALDYYNKAIAQDENCAQCLFHKGHVLAFMDKTNEAKEVFNKGFELEPGNPQLLLEQGRIKFYEGKPDEAYDFFIKAAEASSNPNIKAEALTSASNIKRNQGYIKEALELSTQAMNINSKLSAVLSAHGFNLAFSGKWQEGVNVLYEATLANSRTAQPYWWMGIVLRQTETYDDAINYLKIAIDKVDNDNTLLGVALRRGVKAQMMYDLARTYVSAGNSQEALSMLEDSVKMSGNVRDLFTKDYKRGFYKSLENESRFKALVI